MNAKIIATIAEASEELQSKFDAARFSKALGMVFAGQIKYTDAGEWIAYSQEGKATYRVNLDALTCECPDFQKRACVCKHLIGAQVLNAARAKWNAGTQANATA